MMKRDFKGILIYLKKYMRIKLSKQVVKNVDVAKELGIKNANRVNLWENRNSTPHDVILAYCLKEDINPLNIFFDRKVKP